jgi:hypothetical protein
MVINLPMPVQLDPALTGLISFSIAPQKTTSGWLLILIIVCYNKFFKKI